MVIICMVTSNVVTTLVCIALKKSLTEGTAKAAMA